MHGRSRANIATFDPQDRDAKDASFVGIAAWQDRDNRDARLRDCSMYIILCSGVLVELLSDLLITI